MQYHAAYYCSRCSSGGSETPAVPVTPPYMFRKSRKCIRHISNPFSTFHAVTLFHFLQHSLLRFAPTRGPSCSRFRGFWQLEKWRTECSILLKPAHVLRMGPVSSGAKLSGLGLTRCWEDAVIQLISVFLLTTISSNRANIASTKNCITVVLCSGFASHDQQLWFPFLMRTFKLHT